ncbi:glycosyltransferase family 71 protein [Babjeviella inositovora NRRL Y-12698]|uniref:Glycosyltransferase family 71 protein n=1 Tax=Babjeviella inositovora NRRL Y-12698 TaxID=984486 RepID=A0A1E3QSC9_9ASCO|nr:glycosyltransferase family 71 protein [Babjeviella inositovora NRRL Y-12698]ODQ80570.1 glycosyltransferase family 71 protein [Babjeviella inositovora NRRL Y-12698]
MSLITHAYRFTARLAPLAVRLRRHKRNLVAITAALTILCIFQASYSRATTPPAALQAAHDHFRIPSAIEYPADDQTIIEDSCNKYFSYVSQFGTINTDPHLDYRYNLAAFDRLKFINDRFAELIDKFTHKITAVVKEGEDPNRHEKEQDAVSKLTRRTERLLRQLIVTEYDAVALNNAAIEAETVERIRRIRRFNQCFVPKQDLRLDLFDCGYLERKLFPVLTRQWPVFQRWDGQLVANGNIPHLEKVGSGLENNYNITIFNGKNNGCYMKALRDSFKGRGIVLSASDLHKSELIGLIKVLRSVGNTLPIQVMHRNDITMETRVELISWARRDEIPLPESYAAFASSQALPHVFPKQELWFVDISIAVTRSRSYDIILLGYANKLLAYLFSSFSETILMDTDTVPLVNPELFFSHSVYQTTSTLFFKDRQLEDKTSVHTINFFRTTLIDALEGEDYDKFRIPRLTEYTRKSGLFANRESHIMESGVVVIDRVKHFHGVVMALQLIQLEPTKMLSWGDKELFWLGLAASGDESYGFNHFRTAAVGQFQPALITGRDSNGVEMSFGDGSTDKFDPARLDEFAPRFAAKRRVCLTHPGHINSDDGKTLMWINSGFKYCKLNLWEIDAKKQFYSGLSEPELQQLYREPFRISAAIIPPLVSELQAGGVVNAKGEYEFELAEAKMAEEVPKKDEPESRFAKYGLLRERPWKHNTNVCRGYIWCAYDEVHGVRGQVVEFGVRALAKFKFLGDVWFNEYTEEEPQH